MTNNKLPGGYDALFGMLAIVCVILGVYHLYGIYQPELRAGYPWQRHLFWIVACLVGSYFLINRTIYFMPILLILLIQQLLGHGSALLASLSSSKSIQFTDLFAVVFVSTLFVLYVLDIYQSRLLTPTTSKPDK